MMKVMEREGKLGELEGRAETLQQGSEQFQVIIIFMIIMMMMMMMKMMMMMLMMTTTMMV